MDRIGLFLRSLVTPVLAALQPCLLSAQTPPAPAPLTGADLQSLNGAIEKLEKSGWDSDGDGSLDKGILDILSIDSSHPLYAELQMELVAAGIALDDTKKKCVMGALMGLKAAAKGDQDGKDENGKVKWKSRVVSDPKLVGVFKAEVPPEEVWCHESKSHC